MKIEWKSFLSVTSLFNAIMESLFGAGRPLEEERRRKKKKKRREEEKKKEEEKKERIMNYYYNINTVRIYLL